MATVIDPSTVIGSFFTEIINHVTGDPFLAVFAFILFLVALGMAFMVPIEITMIGLLPFVFIAILISSNVVTILGVIIFYFAVVIARSFPYI